jgi:hypothetical protein
MLHSGQHCLGASNVGHPGLAQLPLLDFLSGFRDIVIIVWGIISIVLLLTLIVVMLSLVAAVRSLIHTVNDLANTGVKPVLTSAQETVDNVADTTRFLGDHVVAPVIRTISIISAVRRGLAVFSGLTHRGRERESG